MGIAQIWWWELGNAQKEGVFVPPFCDSFPQRSSLLGIYHFNPKYWDKTRLAESYYKSCFCTISMHFGRNGPMATGWLVKNIHQRQTGRNKKL